MHEYPGNPPPSTRSLPRKSDMEKKVDIVQYAQQTRQLYVRLLALVKWAASASKVDKCCVSMRFSLYPIFLLVPKPGECTYQSIEGYTPVSSSLLTPVDILSLHLLKGLLLSLLVT